MKKTENSDNSAAVQQRGKHMSEKKQYKAVLFDMDGVLIDSEELMAKSGILALADYGITAKAEDFIPFVGRGENLYIGGVAEKYGVPFRPEMKERCYYYYGLHVEQEAFIPKEIPEILYTIKNMGYKIAVCTSADWGKVKHNLRAMGVEKELFDGLVTGDRIKNLKPDPEIYLTGAALVGAEPSECIVVEDSPSGIKAAHAGNMLAIGIDTSFSEEDLVAQSHPDVMIHHLSELLQYL